MKIEVRESTIIHPAKDTPKHSLWLSDLDLMIARLHRQTVYFYKPNNSPNNFFSPKVLKEALSEVLVPFYPVAGRLGKDENGRYEIQCNGEGVLFVEAQTESTIDDEFGGDFTPRLEFQKLVPTIDYSAHFSSYPLLVLQVTYFKCGGVCLGVGFHHTVIDGISAIHFINTWSDMARGLPITVSPFIDRTILRARDPPTPTFHHIEYDPSPTPKFQSDSDLESKSDSTSTCLLEITVDQLNTLRAQANKNENQVRYSTYATLATHLWRCACIAYGLSDDQVTKLYTTADGRSRLNPPLPAGYMGNVQFNATSIASASDIRSRPLADTAEKIQKAVARLDNNYLMSALDFLALQPDPTAFIRGSHVFRCPNLSPTSWITLPIHNADFGWGRPVFMGPARVQFEGKAYILPSPTKDRSLSVVICLETHHMEVFRKVFYELISSD